VKTSVPITYLLDTYENPRGGTESQFLQLVTRIDRSRYVPSVVMLRSSDWVETHSMGCHLTVLGIWKLARFATLTKLLRLGRNLRRKGCRIVHCYFNDVSLVAPIILSLCGLRIIVSRRDMGIWYTPFKLWLLRLNARFVDSYVANSEAVKRVVRQCEWVPEERIRVIYNGYCSELGENANSVGPCQQLGLERAGPIIGVVANVRKVKRIDTLIRAFSLICRQYSNLSVMIVGDVHHDQAREEMENLGRLIADLGLDHRVEFIGAVADPRPYIHVFSVAVLCSESEGLSNSLIEYMQAGRPIVCTDVGGNSELIRDGDNGFLIRVNDWQALADRTSLIVSDSELAKRMGARARETVRAMISVERMAREQMACYDDVLSRYAPLANSVSLT
jgi:L-malate glycosyltransferase